MVTMRNRFDTFQEISEMHTLNDKYENFITAQLIAAAECTPTKLKAKCRVLCKALVVRKK